MVTDVRVDDLARPVRSRVESDRLGLPLVDLSSRFRQPREEARIRPEQATPRRPRASRIQRNQTRHVAFFIAMSVRAIWREV